MGAVEEHLRLEELLAVLGELGLEEPQVVLGRLVLLRLRDLLLDVRDLLQDAHGEALGGWKGGKGEGSRCHLITFDGML